MYTSSSCRVVNDLACNILGEMCDCGSKATYGPLGCALGCMSLDEVVLSNAVVAASTPRTMLCFQRALWTCSLPRVGAGANF